MEFDALMLAFCEALGIDPVKPDETGAYYFAFDETSVSILPMHEARKVVFYAPLCEAPERGAGKLAEALLKGNFLYQGGAGAVFAQDPETGHIVLERYESLADLDVKALETALESFLTLIEHWRAVIAAYASEGGEASEKENLKTSEAMQVPTLQMPSNWLAV